jgi:hypothetical protein
VLGKWFVRKLLAKTGKRFPLKTPPLRVPAQELRGRFDECLLEIFFFVVMSVLAGILTIITLATVRPLVFLIFSGAKLSPASFIILASVVVAPVAMLLFLRKVRQRHRELRDVYIGMLAETYVGQQLERLRAFGCSIFHDIIEQQGTKRFNVDHVVIGRFGIAVIETKGRSKPASGETVLWTTNTNVQFCDGSYSAEPITQVKANERLIRDIFFERLKEAGNQNLDVHRKQDIPIRAILCYPGWFVDFDRSDCSDVYVTNDELLLQYLRKREPVWTQKQVTTAAQIFGEYLRNKRRGVLLTD